MHGKDAFYQRQMTLDEVGRKGQDCLMASRVLVIGAGGLGCPVLEYLTAAGIGHICICDFDIIDYTNLHRQVLYSPKQVGQYKADAAAQRLSEQNPHVKIEVRKDKFDINFDITVYDVIIDCSDNFEAKFIAHDLCYQNHIPLIQASIHKFEGQLQVFHFDKPALDTPCLRCLWPKTPEKSCVQSCSEAGVLGVVPGVVGSLQASEAIKLVLGLPTLPTGESLIINLFDFSTQRIRWPKVKECPLCQFEQVNLSDFTYNASEFELDLADIEGEDWAYINLAGADQTKVDCSINSNLNTLTVDVAELNKQRKILLCCNRGITSLKGVKLLRAAGYHNCFSLKDGIQNL
jgi:adenylyltransferase/sulfurtransferase